MIQIILCRRHTMELQLFMHGLEEDECFRQIVWSEQTEVQSVPVMVTGRSPGFWSRTQLLLKRNQISKIDDDAFSNLTSLREL
uniref:Uncharacterized protein n=1 Tax=Timema poppense TaxID=170557 RepID=A0A7R9DGB1_TIMPO|nr:unnamed protein product [Timema poppensis]